MTNAIDRKILQGEGKKIKYFETFINIMKEES